MGRTVSTGNVTESFIPTGKQTLFTPSPHRRPQVHHTPGSSETLGFEVPKRATRFPDKVRNYFQEKFDVGSATGHKADPVQVSIDMRCARDGLGRRLFAASECLQTQEIRSFFSRLAAAQRKNVQSPADLIEDDVRDLESDSQAEQYEIELQI